ncbi:hypothetical protein RZ024_01775 [Citrobacter freundii]|uniref:Uncharacterized protein n=1 Tax=Citrobacter freundii TaxID=546 RepID=A0AAP5XVN8_CITFR|nr:hypothetical protein [Citrobacter freundii]ELT3491733.1 hypothetical protein [Citrobacter freundii]MCW0941528.1 hypothetical protein [Citrobacter freundii]MDV2190283.1 hypothetical protein [Citrobacter freundii]MDW2759600.1 hypothetical protein [Citrobacter freundii]MEB0532562.1 hypothetical protein [Citrobacter freundii]
MNKNAIPKISLFNTDKEVKDSLLERHFNVESHQLNGIKKFLGNDRGPYRNFKFRHDIPPNLHESDVIIIDTKKSYLLDSEKMQQFGLYFDQTPEYIDLMPFEIDLIRSQIRSSKKKRCVIVFCEQLSSEKYNITHPKTGSVNSILSSTYNFDFPISVSKKNGSRFKSYGSKAPNNIIQCITDHSEGLEYNVVFNVSNNSDIVSLANESGEVISFYRFIDGSFYLFMPVIKNKNLFLVDLLENVLPDTSELSELFPLNGSFKWEHDIAYLSKEEIDLLEEDKNLDIKYQESKDKISKSLSIIRNKDENLFLKDLLKETGDKLVFAVEWFLNYIGFNNIQRPDEHVQEGEVLEEDLRINELDKVFLIEVKGIGGTSTDAQCSQVSKVVLRNRKIDTAHKYIGIYIVNHQRYKAPLERIIPPFNVKQIEDAEMSYRGMTYTFELFNVYHMIEQEILSKDDVRDCFLKDGLLDFRKSLTPLPKPHVFTGHSVYSFDLEGNSEITIKNTDYIVVCDSECHWHKINIMEIQVNKIGVEHACNAKVGIKVGKLIVKPKEFYLLSI